MTLYTKKQLIDFLNAEIRERTEKGEKTRNDGEITIDMLYYAMYVLKEELK